MTRQERGRVPRFSIKELLAAIGVAGLSGGVVALIFRQYAGALVLGGLCGISVLTVALLYREECIRADRPSEGGNIIYSRSYHRQLLFIGVVCLALAALLLIQSIERFRRDSVAPALIALVGVGALLFLSGGAIANVVLARRLQAGRGGRFAKWWLPGWRRGLTSASDKGRSGRQQGE